MSHGYGGVVALLWRQSSGYGGAKIVAWLHRWLCSGNHDGRGGYHVSSVVRALHFRALVPSEDKSVGVKRKRERSVSINKTLI